MRAHFSWLMVMLGAPALVAGGIMLFPLFSSRPAAKHAFLSGQVADEAGPVAGALVRFKGDGDSVMTDDEGRFQLSTKEGSRRVTAWKEGYFIGGQPSDANPLVVRLHKLPDRDHEGYEWVNPGPNPEGEHNCANCHAEIYREWQGGGHAKAAKGKRFLNLYDGSDWTGKANVGWSLKAEHHDGVTVCNSCHAPTAELDADLSTLRGVAAQGVHCDYCHKIDKAGLGKIGLTHGRYGLNVLRPAKGQLFFGPLEDVDRGDDAALPLYRQSLYCASCHEGTVFGTHVYSTYSEWQASPARKDGKQCQSCHMSPTGKLTNIAPGHGGIERDPKTLANHVFFKGSQVEMLRNSLQLTVQATKQENEIRVVLVVRASNVGHKVPTGFIDRQLIVVVEGLTKDGPVAALDGPKLPTPAGKDLADKSGKLYAKLLEDFDGNRPAPFWRPARKVEDTRLKPETDDLTTYVFPVEVEKVRVRLLYRKFWDEVTRTKGWPDETVTVKEQTVEVGK